MHRAIPKPPGQEALRASLQGPPAGRPTPTPWRRSPAQQPRVLRPQGLLAVIRHSAALPSPSFSMGTPRDEQQKAGRWVRGEENWTPQFEVSEGSFLSFLSFGGTILVFHFVPGAAALQSTVSLGIGPPPPPPRSNKAPRPGARNDTKDFV